MSEVTVDGIIPVLEHELKLVDLLFFRETGFRERSVLNLASKNIIAAMAQLEVFGALVKERDNAE